MVTTLARAVRWKVHRTRVNSNVVRLRQVRCKDLLASVLMMLIYQTLIDGARVEEIGPMKMSENIKGRGA